MKKRLAANSRTQNVTGDLAGKRRFVRAVVISGMLFGSSFIGFAEPVFSQGAAGGETAALKARVQQLEEQLVDMQVVIGTLESMGRSGAAGPAPASGGGFAGGAAYGGGADSARLDGVETQIRAMTAQIEQLSREVRGMSGGVGPRGDAGGASQYNAPASGYAAGPSPAPAPAIGGFGSTTITPSQGGGGDAIGGFIANNDWQNSQQVAAASPGGGGDPKILYETAYGYLLQQDYGAAETSFGEFLQRYPQDELAGNAQYWLGESYYVRGQYKTAAEAFLKGYKTYRDGSKASDSLLKLAMSLEKLGQRDAACSSLSELTARFPDAPPHVKNRAASERARAGC